jgi:hypothetical protein
MRSLSTITKFLIAALHDYIVARNFGAAPCGCQAFSLWGAAGFFCHSCGKTWIIDPASSVRSLIERDFIE